MSTANKRDVICFYRPYGKYACFSNFFQHRPITFKFPCEFIDKDEITFTFSEKALMACKAAFFGDDLIFAKILKSKNPSEVKALGRKVSGYCDDVWDEFREYFAYLILKEKFSGCEKMKRTLLDTGDSILAEASSGDFVWGIGRSLEEPECYDSDEWLGRNLLGEALMRVRGDLSLA